MNFVKRDLDIARSVAVRGLGKPQAPDRKWPIGYDSVEPFTVLTDVLIILSASLLAGVTHHLRIYGTSGDVMKFLGAAAVVATLFVSMMKSRGMYKPSQLLDLRHQISTILMIWSAVFLLLASTVFVLKINSEFSRDASMLFAVGGFVALAGHRIFWRSVLAEAVIKGRFSGRKVVLLTDYRYSTQPNLPHILMSFGFRLERHFKLPPPERGARKREEVISKTIACVRGSEIEEILVGADLNHWPELRDLIAELRILPCPVNLIPVGAMSEIFRRPSHEIGNSVCIEVQRGPLTPGERAAKRTIDIVLATVGLVALLPLLTIVAIAIKLDSHGPVLFRQRRCGFNGRSFQIFKFRTMTVLEDGPVIAQATLCDQRITRLGAWLRRTSIDELPQLLNVLGGSMSLVGPRPHALAHDSQFDKVIRRYAFRQRVKPGLTGWAQVNGFRGPTPSPREIESRVEHDLWYIDNWSLGLDIMIILQTAIEVFRARNAY